MLHVCCTYVARFVSYVCCISAARTLHITCMLHVWYMHLRVCCILQCSKQRVACRCGSSSLGGTRSVQYSFGATGQVSEYAVPEELGAAELAMRVRELTAENAQLKRSLADALSVADSRRRAPPPSDLALALVRATSVREVCNAVSTHLAAAALFISEGEQLWTSEPDGRIINASSELKPLRQALQSQQPVSAVAYLADTHNNDPSCCSARLFALRDADGAPLGVLRRLHRSSNNGEEVEEEEEEENAAHHCQLLVASLAQLQRVTMMREAIRNLEAELAATPTRLVPSAAADGAPTKNLEQVRCHVDAWSEIMMQVPSKNGIFPFFFQFLQLLTLRHRREATASLAAAGCFHFGLGSLVRIRHSLDCTAAAWRIGPALCPRQLTRRLGLDSPGRLAASARRSVGLVRAAACRRDL